MKLAAATVLVGTLATGCADDDYTDLEAFADETTQKLRAVPASEDNSVPSAPSAAPSAYAAGEMRSPFQPPTALKRISGESLVGPDFEREKEILEEYPLAQLRLVGNLSAGHVHVALVQDPDGLVHPVGVGDHMGTDFGRILAVGDAGIELAEIVRDAGGWVERTRFVAMTREQGVE